MHADMNPGILFHIHFFTFVFQQSLLQISDQWFLNASNYFEMAYNANRSESKKPRQRGQSERRNCQQKCFHSFNYVIDHASMGFLLLRK